MAWHEVQISDIQDYIGWDPFPNAPSLPLIHNMGIAQDLHSSPCSACSIPPWRATWRRWHTSSRAGRSNPVPLVTVRLWQLSACGSFSCSLNAGWHIHTAWAEEARSTFWALMFLSFCLCCTLLGHFYKNKTAHGLVSLWRWKKMVDIHLYCTSSGTPDAKVAPCTC